MSAVIESESRFPGAPMPVQAERDRLVEMLAGMLLVGHGPTREAIVECLLTAYAAGRFEGIAACARDRVRS